MTKWQCHAMTIFTKVLFTENKVKEVQNLLRNMKFMPCRAATQGVSMKSEITNPSSALRLLSDDCVISRAL